MSKRSLRPYVSHVLIFSLIFQAEKISTILKAADVKVEPYWPGLFAKALDGVDVKALITNVGSGAGAAPAAGGAAPAAAAGKLFYSLVFQHAATLVMIIRMVR